jgi:hypothetical protein
MINKMSLTSKIKLQHSIILLIKLNFKIAWDDVLNYNINEEILLLLSLPL